jgi:hypothetical protein
LVIVIAGTIGCFVLDGSHNRTVKHLASPGRANTPHITKTARKRQSGSQN